MTDEEFMGILGGVAMLNRRDTVASLLQGNDTGCFTTEQYEMAYCKLHWGADVVFGKKLFGWDPQLSHQHLLSVGMEEVSPDIWIDPKTRSEIWETK